MVETDKLTKYCYMVERGRACFVKYPTSALMKMCGWYEPDGDKWEVKTEWEGEGYTAETQFEAIVVSFICTQKWLFHKAKLASSYVRKRGKIRT